MGIFLGVPPVFISIFLSVCQKESSVGLGSPFLLSWPPALVVGCVLCRLVLGAVLVGFLCLRSLGFVMSRSVRFARSLRIRRGARCSVVPVRLSERVGGRSVPALWTWSRGAVAVRSLFL